MLTRHFVRFLSVTNPALWNQWSLTELAPRSHLSPLGHWCHSWADSDKTANNITIIIPKDSSQCWMCLFGVTLQNIMPVFKYMWESPNSHCAINIKCLYPSNNTSMSYRQYLWHVGCHYMIDSLYPDRCSTDFKYVIFLNILLWMLSSLFLMNVAMRWMPFHIIDDKSTMVPIMAWCPLEKSHFQNQCRLRSMSPYGITNVCLWHCWQINHYDVTLGMNPQPLVMPWATLGADIGGPDLSLIGWKTYRHQTWPV